MSGTPRKPTPADARRAPAYPLWEPHHPEEPAYALLARVAERNDDVDFLGRMQTLLGAYGGHNVGKVSTSHAARICGADAGAVANATPRIARGLISLFGFNIRRDDFSIERRRWCSACLEEHGAHLAWWDLTFMDVCPRHRVKLREACDCGRVVKWRGSRQFTRCECGMPHAWNECEAVPAQETAAAEYILSRLVRGDLRNKFLDTMPPHDVLEVMRNVGHLAIGPLTARRPLETRVGLGRVLQAGFEALADFPRSLHAVLDEAVESAALPGGKYGTRRTYGDTFMTWLQQEEPRSLGGRLSDAVREHAVENVLLIRDTLLGQKFERPGINLTEVADAAGCGYARARRLLQHRGQLPERTWRGTPLKIDRAVAETLIDQMRHGKTLEQVGRELGAVPQVMQKLIREGHLECVIPPEKGLAPVMAGDCAEKLMRRILSLPRTPDAPRSLPVHLASKSLCLPIAKLVTEVLECKIQVVGLDPSAKGLRSVLLDVDSRRAEYRKARSDVMTARDVARAYGIKEEISIDLLRVGAIPSRRDGYAWSVDKADAAAFFEEHVRLGPYADRLGTSKQHLARVLERSGIEAAWGPPVIGWQKFFRRADVDGFLEKERWPPTRRQWR